MAKRKADGEEVTRNLVEIIPLGAGQEVGRSCIIVKYMCAFQSSSRAFFGSVSGKKNFS